MFETNDYREQNINEILGDWRCSIPPGSESDGCLTTQIRQLWQDHQLRKSAVSSESQNLRIVRAELGKHLHEMKSFLVRPGKNGRWHSWLKEVKIPRATADRLVQKHEAFLNPLSNCLTESIAEPTEEEIQRLVASITPRLKKTLRTEASVERFMDQLATEPKVSAYYQNSSTF